MRALLFRFCLVVIAFGLWAGPASAFDVVSGGGEALITQTNVDNATKVLVSDLLLTTNTAVTSETVTITIPAGMGTLEFSTDPVAITADDGNLVVANLNQTTSQIDFEITGSGTLRVQNIGLYNTNAATFVEDRQLNTNFQAGNFTSDLFRVDTRDIAVAFGGGQQLNVAHASSSTAQTLDDLAIVSANNLTDEVFTITFDPAIGFTSQATGAISLAGAVDTLVGTTMTSLNDFSEGDTVTVTDSQNTTSQFLVTDTNTVADFEAFFLGITGLNGSFDDPNDEMDLTADFDFTISSTGSMPDLPLDADEPARLQFNNVLPNFVTVSGDISVDNISLTGDQLQFEVSGSGRLEVRGVQVFADNVTTKEEFFETRFLNVNAQATDLAADLFVVDNTDYSSKVSTVGSSGGPGGDVFIVGDLMNLSFIPFDFSARFGAIEVDLSQVGGSNKADFNNVLTIVADDDDGSFTLPVVAYYSGTNVQANFLSQSISVDNQPPVFDFTNHIFLELPTGKTVAGINDIVTLRMPPESSGDTIVFTADFSSIAGSIANFIEAPAVDTGIALQEVAVDNAAFSVPITFTDDAGNSAVVLNTNQISVDLIRPVLATANILSIVGGPVPGVIGNTVQVDLPADTVGSVGDTITYNLDMSAVGGGNANFAGVDAAQAFTISGGTLDDVLFNQTLTVFDKALNTVVATTNDIQIDNQVPVFNISCGATFEITDVGDNDTNQIADINNGVQDVILFRFPDKTNPACDLDRFTVDLSSIEQGVAPIPDEQDANGGFHVFTLSPGTLDDPAAHFPLTIFDTNGNSTNFLTGPLNVDQTQALATSVDDRSVIVSGKQSNGEITEGGRINVQLNLAELDVVNVVAEIPGAASPVTLIQSAPNVWTGSLLIGPGLFIFEPNFVRYNITDDAGNFVALNGDKVFYITNDTRVRDGGGGGSLNFSNITKKANFQRFTPSQSKEFHDLNTAKKQKSAEQLRLDSLRRRMSYPGGSPSRIEPKPLSLIEQQREAWRARQAALKKDSTPKKLQTALEKLIFNKETKKDIEAARDDKGDFRLRSTLDNLKGADRNALSKLGSRRKVAPHHRGKFLEIKR